MNPSSAYIANSSVGDDRAHQLARLALGPALAPRVVARDRLGPAPRARRRSTAGRPREEDDALGVAGHVGEVADHRRLAAAAVRWSGRRPTSPGRAGGGTPRSGAPRRVSTSGSPSASRTSPCPGFIRTSFIAIDYASGPAGAPAAGEREHVDRPRAGADLGEAVADGLGGDLLRPARGVRQLLAASQERRQRRGVGAPGAVGGARPGSAAPRSAASPRRRRACPRRPRCGRR